MDGENVRVKDRTMIYDYYDNGKEVSVGLVHKRVKDGKVLFEVIGYPKDANKHYKYDYLRDRLIYNDDGTMNVETEIYNLQLGDFTKLKWVNDPDTGVTHVHHYRPFGTITSDERVTFILKVMDIIHYSKTKIE